MNRETIYAALFDKVAAAADFVTTSRRLRHWTDVAPPEHPALFQAQKDEVVAYPALGASGVWTFAVRLYLYVYSSDPYASAAQALNPLVDAVLDALAPPAYGDGGRPVQTLGLPGVVQHCRVAGAIETDEGVLGDQAVAIIPVEIFCVE